MNTPRNNTEQSAPQRVGVKPSLVQEGVFNSARARIAGAFLTAMAAIGGTSGCEFMDHHDGHSGGDAAEEDKSDTPEEGSCDGENEKIAPKVVPIEDSCRIDGGVANIIFDVPEFDECRAPLTVTLYAAIQTQGNNGELRTDLVPLDAPIVAYEAGQYNMATSIGTGAILYLVLEVMDDTGATFRTAPFCSASAV